jgi:hypothetical protein
MKQNNNNIKTINFSNLSIEEKNDYLTNLWLKDEMTKIYEFCEGDRKNMHKILYLMPFHRSLLSKIDKLIFDFKDKKEDTIHSQNELFELFSNSQQK